MRQITLLLAMAALIGCASNASAFHPCQPCCTTTKTYGVVQYVPMSYSAPMMTYAPVAHYGVASYAVPSYGVSLHYGAVAPPQDDLLSAINRNTAAIADHAAKLDALKATLDKHTTTINNNTKAISDLLKKAGQ